MQAVQGFSRMLSRLGDEMFKDFIAKDRLQVNHLVLVPMKRPEPGSDPVVPQ